MAYMHVGVVLHCFIPWRRKIGAVAHRGAGGESVPKYVIYEAQRANNRALRYVGELLRFVAYWAYIVICGLPVGFPNHRRPQFGEVLDLDGGGDPVVLDGARLLRRTSPLPATRRS